VTDKLTYALTDGVAVVTLDDGKANALAPDLIEQLMAAIARAESEAKVLLLVGRPGKFCAGFDLKIMMSSAQAAKDLVRQGGEMLLALYECPLPVVVACTGHAVAGGALMLLAADTRIGVEGPFRIGLNETAIGLQLPILGQEFARDRLDPRALTAAVIQARMYSPAAAADVGYLDAVAAPEALAAAAMEAATQLAQLSGPAYAGVKRSLRKATLDHIRATIDEDLANLATPH
jgi:enoyl-CoA hydratase